jgi:hypothetical protein
MHPNGSLPERGPAIQVLSRKDISQADHMLSIVPTQMPSHVKTPALLFNFSYVV